MIKTIKSLFHLFAAAAVSVAVAGCSDSGSSEIPEDDAVITISPESIEADPAGGESVIEITASRDWSISTPASWVTVFPTGGLKNNPTKIRVKIDANKDGEKREAIMTVLAGNTSSDIKVSQTPAAYLKAEISSLSFGAQESSATVPVRSNLAWNAASSQSWCAVTVSETELAVRCSANTSNTERTAVITVTAGDLGHEIRVTQFSDAIITPEGYNLVWHDEFNTADGTQPDLGKWYYEVWAPGFVNNELQRYVAGSANGVKTAEIINGILNIRAQKVGDEVISARLNTKELWQYGYFEARLKLPKGKGTWPAFWMMPADGNNWPHCGEIDIMEEVGVNPNFTSSSIHCTAYNHTIGTQKTAERHTPGAEDEFHVYALEWTEDYIRTYVDGTLLLSFANDKKGDENTWPFSKPFHPILNLAWGGSWGGMNGVDESFLPATYQIDYVRVFQKF